MCRSATANGLNEISNSAIKLFFEGAEFRVYCMAEGFRDSYDRNYEV